MAEPVGLGKPNTEPKPKPLKIMNPKPKPKQGSQKSRKLKPKPNLAPPSPQKTGFVKLKPASAHIW